MDLFSSLKYKDAHVSRTSNACKNDEFYVMKEETRLDGPWTDAMVAKPRGKVPRDIAHLNSVGLRLFQQRILEQVSIYEPDLVDVIVHPKGMAGKSIIVKKICFDGMGEELPFCNDFRDLMRMAYDVQIAYSRAHLKDCPAFFIDMPRATNKTKLYQLYAAIENLKRGKAYDDRYSYKRCYFDPPRVFVFTNTKPDMSLLTYERWRLWTIDDMNDLVPYDSHDSDAHEIVDSRKLALDSIRVLEEFDHLYRSDSDSDNSGHVTEDNIDYDELDLDLMSSN